MEIEKLKDDLEWLSFTAAMNQRYHQSEAARYGQKDHRVKLAVGISGVWSLIISISAAFNSNEYLQVSAFLITVITTVAAVYVNISKADEKQKASLDLFRRWTDVRQDVDTTASKACREKLTQKEVDFLFSRYEELLFKKNSLNGQEVDAIDEKLLEKCYEDENESRTGYRTQKDKDAGIARKQTPSMPPQLTATA